MTIVIGGTNPAVTFPDGTIQNTSAVVGSSVPYSVLPTGSVLQVVQASSNTSIVTSAGTGSQVATTLTATITPKFSTSKILVIATIQGLEKYPGNAATGAYLYLYKNGANVINYALYVGYTNTSAYNLVGSNTLNYLDSPATTSATTYAIYIASSVSGQQVSSNADSDTSTITLMEIAG
jgi:hypothetical protein